MSKDWNQAMRGAGRLEKVSLPQPEERSGSTFVKRNRWMIYFVSCLMIIITFVFVICIFLDNQKSTSDREDGDKRVVLPNSIAKQTESKGGRRQKGNQKSLTEENKETQDSQAQDSQALDSQALDCQAQVCPEPSQRYQQDSPVPSPLITKQQKPPDCRKEKKSGSGHQNTPKFSHKIRPETRSPRKITKQTSNNNPNNILPIENKRKKKKTEEEKVEEEEESDITKIAIQTQKAIDNAKRIYEEIDEIQDTLLSSQDTYEEFSSSSSSSIEFEDDIISTNNKAAIPPEAYLPLGVEIPDFKVCFAHQDVTNSPSNSNPPSFSFSTPNRPLPKSLLPNRQDEQNPLSPIAPKASASNTNCTRLGKRNIPKLHFIHNNDVIGAPGNISEKPEQTEQPLSLLIPVN